MNKFNIKLVTIIVVVFYTLFAYGCRPYVPTPKPRGYFRIDFPEKDYQQFSNDSFPFTFEYPTYATITKDSNSLEDRDNPYWLNIYIPSFDATIYLSYKQIDSKQSLQTLVEESFKLSGKHDVKADYIKTPPIKTSKGNEGFLYIVGGNAASAYQFFLTDENHSAMRGSLYFNVAPNADSLAPMYDFLKKDLDVLIESFEFK